jgi:8-hydroxy-5-deazaflavin:NADPH oxidoreductase
MSTIGILGAGRIGRALAFHFVKAGYNVILANRRGPASLQPLLEELGSNAKAGTSEEAAAAAIVVVAIGWVDLPGALSELGPFDGRIVIDTCNAYIEEAGQLRVADLQGRSSSEIVAELVPGARLVKAFNTLFASVLAADPQEAGGRRVIFLSGDDGDAKGEVKVLAEKVGFAPVDLGALISGGRPQQARGPLNGANLIRL